MTTHTCDMCKKEFREDTTPDDIFEVQEMLHVDFVGGYDSTFGDGRRIKFDLCQHCLLIVIETFLPHIFLHPTI